MKSRRRTHPLNPRRLAVVLAIVGVTGGCSAASGPNNGIPQAAATALAEAPTPPDYDPARAFLTLEQIEPAPAPPDHAAPLSKPLSARGARFIQQARDLNAAERYTEATRALEKALRSDPASHEVHGTLALAAHAAGNSARARSHATEAVRLNANDPAPHYVLGRIALDEGDYADAVRRLRTALACAGPAFWENDGLGAVTEFRLAEALEAEGYLTAAVEAYQAYERHAIRFRSHEAPGAPQEMVRLLRLNRGLAAKPIAAIYERLGRFAEAADAWGRLIDDASAPDTSVRRKPPGVAARLRYAHLLSAAGRQDEALAQCRLAAGEADDPGDVVRLLADIRARMGAANMVLDDVRSLVRDRPDDREWLGAYVDLLRRFERNDQAERIMAEYVAAHPEASDVAWRLCDSYIQAGRGVDAFDLAARVVAADHREYVAALPRLERLSSNARTVEALVARDPPTTPSAQYLLGVLALRSGHARRAEDLFKGALETAVDFVPARLALAETLLAEYRWDEVVDLLDGIEQRDANLEWALGEAYAGLDEDEKAAPHFSAAFRLNRADTRSMLALAALYQRTDRPLRAQRQYEALLEIDPLNEQAREALVKLFIASGLFEEAEAQVRELRKLAGSPGCIARCVVRIGLARGEGTVDEHRRRLLEALRDGEAEAETQVLVASLDIAVGDADSAEQALSRALAVEPDHVEARELLISVYALGLRFDEAASELGTLLRRHPHRRRWVENLAHVLLVEQNYAGAINVLSDFLQQGRLSGPALLGFRLRLLQAMGMAKRFDEQIALLQAWLHEDETDHTLRGALVSAHLAAGDDASALALARQWYLADPNDARSMGAYRDVLVQTGRFTAAQQLVLERLEDDPANEAAQLDLIDILGRAEQFDEALELVESRAAGPHQTFTFLAYKLSLYEQAGRFSDAAALAGRMLRDDGLIRDLRPLNEAVFRERLTRRLIGSLLNAEHFDEAQSKLNRWLDQADSSGDEFLYLNLLAGVYQQQGRNAEAVESLELAYSLDPNDVGINNDFGYTLADIGQRLEEAERMIRFAVARDPMNAAFLDSLGWVLYRRGRFDEAKRWLLKAAGAPDALEDPVIYDHLGDACWRAGARDEAVAHWKKAAALAEERLKERTDVVYRRVVESARRKRRAAESGQPPQVTPVVDAAADRALGGESSTDE